MQTTWNETDALYAGMKGPTLADLILARTAVVEQVEDVVEEEVASVPTVVPAPHAEVTCTSGSCLHARPGSPCHCTCCVGADHGRVLEEAGQRAYARRLATVGGDVFRLLPQVDDDEW